MSTETRRPLNPVNTQSAFPGTGPFPRGQQYYAAEPADLVFGPQSGYAEGNTIESLVGVPGVVNSVRVEATVQIVTSGAANIFLGIKVNGTLYSIVNQDVHDYEGSVIFGSTMTINPKTGVAWVPADIATIGWYAGINRVYTHGVGPQIDDLRYVIDYTALAAPGAPSALSGSPTGFNININWTDNSASPNPEDSFRIERCTGLGCSGFVEIGFVGPGITTYADNSLAPGVYRYRVKAVNVAGSSAYSNTAEIALAASPFVTIVVPGPATAFGLALTPVLMANTVVVPDPARASARMLRPIGLARSVTDPLVGHGRLGYRDNMRTYRDLMDDKNGRGSSKVEFLPGYEVPLELWTIYDSMSGTWQRPLAVIIDQALRDIEGVELGITPYSMTRQESLALCVATANSYFYDRMTQIIYVRTPGGVSPITTTTMALLGFFWSTEKESHPVLGANKIVNPDMDWY